MTEHKSSSHNFDSDNDSNRTGFGLINSNNDLNI
jgi:hypothetical protein